MRSSRFGRVAACTALALSAGTLLSVGQATAAGKASDRPAAATAKATSGPKAAVPHAASPAPGVLAPNAKSVDKGARAAAPQGVAAAATTANVSQPRLDLDGDGFSELVFRNTRGFAGAFATSAAEGSPATDFRIEGDEAETVKDIIALGNVGGGWNPEILTLTFDGKLQLRETSGGTAGAPTWTGTGWQMYNRVISAGDLNKDGRPDVIARTPAGDLYYYRSTGNLANPFAAAVKVSGGWNQYDQIVGLGDIDGDGDADVLGRTYTGELFLHKGTGNGANPFEWRTQIASGWTGYTQIIAADDIDGDGKADMMGVTVTGDLFCHFSEGNGLFSPQYNCGSNWKSNEFFLGAGITPVYGKHNVGTVDAGGQYWSYDNKSDGSLFDPRKAGDFNWPDDGSKLVVAAGMDKLNWGQKFQSNQWGLTNRTTNQNIAGDWWGVTNLVIGGGDVSGDGKGDLLTRDIWGNLYVHQGNGTGNAFAAPINIGGGWDQYKQIAAGDFNGDGNADVVGITNSGDLYFHPGTGKASAPFGARWAVFGMLGGYKDIVSPGDLTGDGKADLVLADANGNLFRMEGGHSLFGSEVLTWPVMFRGNVTYRSIG
ncbi:FG-GAP repeat domain-containing protein [Streptomyces sp. NPDC086989]|uniref:FG-GAP repeat domain-containing protein n=1 Tax=Streptomyces sp. NPDC086989 TaxID=3365764 RepID=UPI00382702E8